MSDAAAAGSAPSASSREGPVALHRCNTFVGRTMNWLYDHLRSVPDYRTVVLCDRVENRDEFPELETRLTVEDRLAPRVWDRLVGSRRVYPPLRRRLRRLEPRVLHSHFGYVAEKDLPLQRTLGVPWLVAFYGADVYELGRSDEWRERYRPVFEEASAVLALGPAMARELSEIGCPRGKIHVHPLGVDVEDLPAAPRRRAPDEELRVLFAGTFREKKGIPYLVRAVAAARASGVAVRLHLVGDAAAKPGDAETKAEVFRLIGALGLADRVEHHSWLPFDELMELALACHVFAAPSVTAGDGDSEGTPFVIQQMMATGMPVVATEHSDIPFLFGEHAGMLVPERDADALADRLRAYAEEPERLIADGQDLLRRAREGLDVRTCAAGLARLYDRLGSDPPAGTPTASVPASGTTGAGFATTATPERHGRAR